MVKTLVFCVVLVSIAPTVAEAQDGGAEIAQADAESVAATALYVTGPVLIVGGLASAIGIGLANLCVAGDCGDRTGVEWGVGVSLAFASLGLLAFIPAIVLDIDSGQRRRRAAGARAPVGPTLSLAPGWIALGW